MTPRPDPGFARGVVSALLITVAVVVALTAAWALAPEVVLRLLRSPL